MSSDHSKRVTAPEVLQRYNEENFPDFCEPLIDVNQIGTFGNRPLHMASYHGVTEEIRALVEGGALVNVTGDLNSTPLHEAVDGGHLDAVKLLLEYGALVDVRNEFGKTPLDIARENGRPDIQLLLQNSLDSSRSK